MDFMKAVHAMQNGKKVRLSHWEKTRFICLQGNMIYASWWCDEDPYIIDMDEMLNTKWEIYKEEPKLHTFEEALVAFRAGKRISREDKNDQNLRYKMGWSNTLHFKEEDLLANDWIIIEG